MKFEDIKHPMKVIYRDRVWWALPQSFWTLDADGVWLSTNTRGNGGMTVAAGDFEPAPEDAFVPPCADDCWCCENGSQWGKRRPKR